MQLTITFDILFVHFLHFAKTEILCHDDNERLLSQSIAKIYYHNFLKLFRILSFPAVCTTLKHFLKLHFLKLLLMYLAEVLFH